MKAPSMVQNLVYDRSEGKFPLAIGNFDDGTSPTIAKVTEPATLQLIGE